MNGQVSDGIVRGIASTADRGIDPESVIKVSRVSMPERTLTASDLEADDIVIEVLHWKFPFFFRGPSRVRTNTLSIMSRLL